MLLLSAAAFAQAQCDGLGMAVCNSTATCVWNAPWKPGVCVDDPCTAALSTSAACEAAEVAVTPCPDPLPDPDYCLFSPCVWKGQCERRPCLHKDQVACDAETSCKWAPPASGVPAGPVRAVVDVCRQDICGHLDKFACFSTAGCTHDLTNGCHAIGCGVYSNAASCGQDRLCHWNITAAQCKSHPCAKNAASPCAGDSGCMWKDSSCLSKTCNKYNDPNDKCACVKDPECQWCHNAYHPSCRQPELSECPDLDVAVVLDGSGSMSKSFGQHPHGFYALMEIMRAWIRTLPLTGDDHTKGANAAKGTGEFRVTFIQLSKANALSSELHPTNCGVGQCTDGLLSGRLDELEGDITWQSNNYQREWTYVHDALQDIADQTFLPTQSPAWRKHVVLIVADGGLTDFDGDSCCDAILGCGNPRCVDRQTFDPTFPAKLNTAQNTLRSQGVTMYGVVIRRSQGHNALDTSAEAKLKTIISDPRDEHFINIMMDELLDKVLNTLCDPNSKFGKGIADPLAGCKGKASEASCKADVTCTWHPLRARDPRCSEDPCFPLCNETTCNRDTLCLWNTSVCEMKPSCNVHVTQAPCEGAGHLWGPIWSVSYLCECNPCKSHTQEPDCVAQTVVMPGPCTPPFGKPDYCRLPVCEFDATSNTCSKLKCLNVFEDMCEKETGCVWTPATPTPDQPVVQVSQCAPPVCTSLPHVCSAGFQLKPTASTTTCPGTPSTCDDATCCVANPLCNIYTCTSGLQLKASASSITCTGTPSACTDATCCEKLCSTHTCSAGFQLKSTPPAIICPGTPSTCTDATCCEKLCSTHTCPARFQLKPTPAGIICPGTPSTCDDATCCVADPLCNTHTCTSGLQLKASASSITCTGTPSACTDATCCEKLCSTHTCPAGFQLKPTPAAIICPGTPSTCDDATCCVADKLCNTHTCTSGSQLKASASSITCTGTPSVCTDVTCCETLCNTHTCSATFLDKPSKATLPCRSTPPVCDDATCCDTEFVCSDHTCGTGFVGNALKGNTSCGARPCPDETCCLASVPVSTFVPAEEQTTARIVGGTTSGTIVVVSAVGGATGASGLGKGGARMARNMVYLSMMDCPRSGVEEVGFVLSPTRLSFGGDDLREVRGAVVGNLALLALVVALVVGVAALRGGCFLVSLAGMPLALPVFLLEMLWMPVMQGGFAFLMYSESEAAGGAAVLTCALLFLVGTGLLTRKAKAQCTFVHNKREKGLVWFVTAAGSWESTDGPRPSVDVLASVFDGFHPAHCLYFVVQLVSMTGLAALAAWNPKTITYCGVRAGMLTILPIVWAAVLLKDLPYLRPIENAVEILITLCEFVFGVLATLAVGDQDQSLYDAAAVLGVVMTYIMMVKTAIDLCTLVYQLRAEYTNHGTVCGPPVRMCCGAGCAKCASLAASKVCFSEPMLASCTSPGTNESETSLVHSQPIPPASSPTQCYACERDGYIVML